MTLKLAFPDARHVPKVVAALEKLLAANDPEDFGCACSGKWLCGPCTARQEQRPFRDILAKLRGSAVPHGVQKAPESNGPEFTDWGRAALLSVLWHHQGGSSTVGQPIRFALGKGAHEPLSDWEVQQAKKWEALPAGVPAPAGNTTSGETPITNVSANDRQA